MKHRIESLDGFKIIGIELSIYKEFENRDIPALWEKFVCENIIDKIPNKINFNMIALYSKYQLAGEPAVGCRDQVGSYAYLIGCKVESLDDIPVGMTGHDVPAAQYAVFKTENNDFPESLQRVWNYINNDSDLKRTYNYDFDVYGTAFKTPEKSVETYVSIK